MSLIEKLNWRYATKKFDHTKKLSPAQLDELLKAVHLSPSSSGLQAYKTLVITDPVIRQKLREAAHNQPQLTDASQIIIFASETNLDAAYVKNHIDHIAKTRQIGRENLEGFEQAINGNINKFTAEEKINWSHKQTYIALGVLLTVAAEMDIDACPMEGFNAEKFDEILGLKEKGLTTAVIAAVGFRSEHDEFSKFIKVRKPKEEMFIHI
jgi:nitroreductase